MGAGTKRKKDSSSSNPRKKQKTSISHGSQGQGQGYQDQGQDGAVSQAEQIICYFCQQPGHFQRDCPRRQESQGYGTPQSQSSMGRARVASRAGQMMCYHCQQPGHMRRDCPRGKDPRISKWRTPSHQWEKREHSLFLHPLVWVRGASINSRVPHHLLVLRRRVT